MRSAAQVTALFPERSSDPLEFVDYRLAETPEEKDEIYRLEGDQILPNDKLWKVME